jgi:hypothetical protein
MVAGHPKPAEGVVMVIDLILDRKDGKPYNARQFYYDCLGYGDVANGITRAMDYSTEKQVKLELCYYISKQEYNPDICGYINKQHWLE